jgi:hypothetical protein
MGFVYLPAHRVLSASVPRGNLSLFASGWRLAIPANGIFDLSFHLQDGHTLRATVDAAAPDTELWGNRDAFWFEGATALNLLPPLEPTAGGIPLPI